MARAVVQRTPAGSRQGHLLKADARAPYSAVREVMEALHEADDTRHRAGHRRAGTEPLIAMDIGNRSGPRGEINVTPLIDIVLVLLIIFMVLTPATLKTSDRRGAEEGRRDHAPSTQ